jgi:hypothetical protein
MSPERWQQLDALFQAAPELLPQQRAAYLDQACAGDQSLRKQVEALLSAHEDAGSFIDTPAFEVEARALTYIVTKNGVSDIWAQPIDGGPPKQLTDFTSDMIFSYAWSRDGKKLALARGSKTSDVVLISDLADAR